MEAGRVHPDRRPALHASAPPRGGPYGGPVASLLSFRLRETTEPVRPIGRRSPASSDDPPPAHFSCPGGPRATPRGGLGGSADASSGPDASPAAEPAGFATATSSSPTRSCPVARRPCEEARSASGVEIQGRGLLLRTLFVGSVLALSPGGWGSATRSSGENRFVTSAVGSPSHVDGYLHISC